MNSGICPRCGSNLTTGGCANPPCRTTVWPLYVPVPPVTPFMQPIAPQVGWLCPKCGRGNAPFMPSCPCTTAAALDREGAK